MSETLSQDPDGLGAAYATLAPNYPPTPATPSSTVQDVPPGSNLPPFSTFSSDMDPGAHFTNDRLFGDTRLLDISNWDYYTDGRIVERTENGLSIITSQPQYRPWESKPVDSSMSATTPVHTFSDAFNQQNGVSKLPSFQSQFQSFNDAVTTSEPTLTTLTNLTPVSPNSTSSPQNQSITTLNSSFHTLSAVNPRSYPLVPAPIQAREIPSIQQQFLDERHIQLYSHPTTNIIHNNTLHSASIFPQNGTIIQSPQIITSPTVVTVLKSEPELKLTPLNSDSGIKIHQNVTLHPTQFQNPLTTLNSTDNGLFNGMEKKINEIGNAMSSPTRNDFRKKERRKMRASSLESSAESDGASSNMDMNNENSGQVAAVSSTDNGYKTNAHLSMGMEHDISGGPMDKQVKKKRKRCGECVGCQRKDNCGDCAPCRNDKSHQICKQRRCEKLTEKKNMFGEPYAREGGKGRGRGRGRGGGSYRGRKPTGPTALLGSTSGGIPPPTEPNGAAVAPPQQLQTRLSPQLTTAVQPMPVQQQPMTPMPFYADPNRFGTPVWQTDPTQGWTQGQFIQQMPSAGQPLETYQQYPNGIYQATYQQPAFETTNTFYTAQPVQVLTNARPPSLPNQQAQMVPPRPNSNYAHTPSPSPAGGQTQTNQSQQYTQFNGQNNNESNSRPSSVNSVGNQNPGTPNQNFNQQQTLVNQQNFSPSSNQQGQFGGSGNGQPGYPQVNVHSPQTTASHTNSGYPGQEQYGGQQNNQQQQNWQQQQQQQQEEQIMWEQHQQQNQDPNNDQEQNYHQQVSEQQQHQEQYNHMNHHQNQDNSPIKSQPEMQQQKTFSQADKINLNTRIKTMILNKQQQHDDDMKSSNEHQNATGHFLWYSHHPHVKANRDDGGPNFISDKKGLSKSINTQPIAQTKTKVNETKSLPINNKNHNYNEQYLKYVQDAADKEELEKIHESKPIPTLHNNSSNVVNMYQNLEKNQVSEEHQYAIREHKDSTNQGVFHPQENTTINRTNQINLDKGQNYQNFSQTEQGFSNPNQCSTNPMQSPNYPQAKMEQRCQPSPNWSQGKYGKWTPSPQSVTPDPQNYIMSPIKKERGYPTPPYTPNSGPYSPQTTSSFVKQEPQSPSATKFLYNLPETNKKPKSEKVNQPNKMGEDIPECNCIPKDRQAPPEPGTYYTHLGCANNLKILRHNLECQTGVTGTAIRIEKVRYTGKEGKTAQGCPIVKWVHRRVSFDEKYLVIVKHRPGHFCYSAFIIIGLVVWEGIPRDTADDLYSVVTEKINKFGLPTKRRCATNDNRTCACQGINEDTCGASFSFGCSWSMYYNGCKFTRSKDVRKFRLSVKEEEAVLENKFVQLADHINPLYKRLAPNSFANQTRFENIASECRLGSNPGRPFSGVTACIDFCAHAHKDIHNMNNGCTVVVTLTKHRDLTKPDDEQLHVLPMYVPDGTDEFESRESQEAKARSGHMEVLNRYNCEVRTFSEPAPTCRALRKEKTSKKRKSQLPSAKLQKSPIKSENPSNVNEIQNGDISSTVTDVPNWRYESFASGRDYKSVTGYGSDNNVSNHLPEFSIFKTPYSYTSGFSNHYNNDGYLQNLYYNNPSAYGQYNNGCATPNLLSYFNSHSNNYPGYKVSNPFDDYYSNNIVPPQPIIDFGHSFAEFKENTANTESKTKSVDIRYTDNSECFKDKDIGGVAIALTHGSVLFECAKHELHASTAVKKPNRQNPTRISLVFYQHRNLNKSQHGLDDYTLKQKIKVEGIQNESAELSFDTSLESSLNSSLESRGELIQRTATLPTYSVTTMFPMHPCIVTGPYQEFLASSPKMPNN